MLSMDGRLSSAGLLVTRRSLVRSPDPPECRGVPETDALPLLLPTGWLSPCVVDSAVGVCMNSYKSLWIKVSAMCKSGLLCFQTVRYYLCVL